MARGFICGTAIENAKDRSTFQQTGLIHLLVVSGGHLQILGFLLMTPTPKRIRTRTGARIGLWVLLFSYCLFTGFQAPVVRAFVSRAMSSVSRFFRWNWDLGKIQIAAGVFCLLLFPKWLFSFSFFLSWLASMGFLLAPLCFSYLNSKSRPRFLQIVLTCGLIQAFAAVVFGMFSWLGVLMNAVFAVPLAMALLVLSLAPLLMPFSISWCDFVWDGLLMALERTLPLAPAANEMDFGRMSWIFLWGFLFVLQVFLHWIYLQRFRSSHV